MALNTEPLNTSRTQHLPCMGRDGPPTLERATDDELQPPPGKMPKLRKDGKPKQPGQREGETRTPRSIYYFKLEVAKTFRRALRPPYTRIIIRVLEYDAAAPLMSMNRRSPVLSLFKLE